MSTYDHIVVGGGVAGMTAAILLAKSGQSVALVESFPLLAPTIRGFRRKGVQFDTGLHYVGGLGDGDPLDIYFKHLGIADSLSKIPYDPSGFDCFRAERTKETYSTPCGFQAMAQMLIHRFPKEADAIERYMDAMLRTINESPFLNFSQEFNIESAFHDDSVTVQTFLDEITQDETLKAILSYPCILYGVPPTKALMSTHALVAGTYILSTHTIEDGGLALARSYEKQLRALNVDVKCKSQVESITIDDDRCVQGVRLSNGEELKTQSCIWTAHPQGLLTATPDNAFRPAFRKRLKTLKDTTSALMLFGISDTPVDMLNGKNVISWPGTSFEECMSGTTSPEESVLYISSALDTKSGKTAVTAIMPAAFDEYRQWASFDRNSRPVSYQEHKKEHLTSLEHEVFHRFPNLKGQVTFIDGATPLTFKEYCATPTGSLYGLCHANDQFNPAPVTKAKGLTLAGQSIVAPGILGAVISAYVTCGIILGHESLHNQLKELA